MFFYERFQTENSHSDTLYFLTGYVTHRNEEFVLELENETARINFNQDINGFDVKLSSNYNLNKEREVPEYLQVDEKNKKVKFVRTPKFEEVPYPVVMEPNSVIEYYSR